MKLLSFIPPVLRNKYLVAVLFFITWMTFFDRNNFFAQSERRSELNKLQESKEYFTEQITAERKFSEELKTNAAAIEKLAREKYYMKRDHEDLFIIQPAENK